MVYAKSSAINLQVFQTHGISSGTFSLRILFLVLLSVTKDLNIYTVKSKKKNGVEVYLHFFLNSAIFITSSCQLYASAAFTPRRNSVLIEQKATTRQPVWTFMRREKARALTGFLTLNPPSRHVVSMPTTLWCCIFCYS